jgi:phage terminase large subunit-like protein
LVDPEDYASVYTAHLSKGTVNDFKTKRMNMWVSASRAWMPDGVLARCQKEFNFIAPPKGVVLGFDGSLNGDSTALVACTVEADPKLIVLGVWEKPIDKNEAIGWKVPRNEVMEAIRGACRTYHVAEVAADEYIWVSELETLAEEGIPVVTFPQTMTRMGPATQRFYELVDNQRISIPNDARLMRHFSHAQIKSDIRGSRLVKDARNSPRKIDLAVASVMAVDRAGFWLTQDGPGTFQGVPVSKIHFVW